MTDNGEPGKNDTIGITVWNKSGGLWYASNWSGTKTVEQILGGGNLVVRNALLLAGSVKSGTGVTTLTAEQLNPILTAAEKRWVLAGQSMASFADLDVQIAELPDNQLAITTGQTVIIDTNAAGRGWFIDTTSGDDKEFNKAGKAPKMKQVDLLTTVAHELGHVLGRDHAVGGVMAEALTPGTRRMPLVNRPPRQSLFSDQVITGAKDDVLMGKAKDLFRRATAK